MAEIRQNLLTGELVVVAPERARRPSDLVPPLGAPSIPEWADDCPFCPGNEAKTAEPCQVVTAADGRWWLRAVPNKFSVLAREGEPGTHLTPLGPSAAGVGRHEVIIEHRRHDAGLARFDAGQRCRLLHLWRDRFVAAYADPRIRHVVVFKNHGSDAGASLQHPHSQLVGLPLVPGQVEERVARAERHRSKTGRCLGCHLLSEERREGVRMVDENGSFVAFVPFAALSPFHLWIFPIAHTACFSDCEPFEIERLADLLGRVLGRLHTALGNPPFNLCLRSLGPRDREHEGFHWYLSVVPRVTRAAGFELGSGMYVNSGSPEENAARLRSASLPELLPPLE